MIGMDTLVLGNDISGQPALCCHLEALFLGPLADGPAAIAAGRGPGARPVARSAGRTGMVDERPELFAEGGRVLGVQINLIRSAVQAEMDCLVGRAAR
jgi:hypothetical protein